MSRQARERLRYLTEAVPLLRKAHEEQVEAERAARERPQRADDGREFLQRMLDLVSGEAERRWCRLLASGTEAELVAELRALDKVRAPRAESVVGRDAGELELAQGAEPFLAAIDRLLGDSKRVDLVRSLCRRRRIGETRATAIIEALKIGNRGAGDPMPTADLILAEVKKATRLSP